MRKETLTSAGSMLVAFLASQHHSLHMMVMAAGAGSAGMGFMTAFPMIRRLMLLMAVLMTGFTLYQVVRRKPPLPMRVVTVASAVVSLGLVAWSVAQYGI